MGDWQEIKMGLDFDKETLQKKKQLCHSWLGLPIWWSVRYLVFIYFLEILCAWFSYTWMNDVTIKVSMFHFNRKG